MPIIGVSLSAGTVRKRRVASSPSMPGMIISIRIKSGRMRSAVSSASCPLSLSNTVKPNGSSTLFNTVRFCSRSSTSRIVRETGAEGERTSLTPAMGRMSCVTRMNCPARSGNEIMSAANTGKSNQNRLPFPNSLCTSIRLPIRSARRRQMASPNPVPSLLNLEAATCSNGSKIC